MEKWELVREVAKIIGIYWMVIFSIIASVVWVRAESKKNNWWRFLDSMKEGVEDLEQKIWSFDEAVEPKFITNEAGVISVVNKAAVELYGYSKEDIKGRNIDVLLADSSKDSFHGMYKSDQGERQFLLDTVSKFGREIPANVWLRKKVVNHHSFMLVILRDRSHEVQAVKKLHQIIEIQKIKLEVLSHGEEIGQSGSWIWDITKRTLLVSPGYRMIMGLNEKQSEFPEEVLRGMVWEKDDHIVKAALDSAFKGRGYDISYHIKRSKDFKLVQINSKTKTIMNENGVLIFIYGSTRFIKASDLIPSDGVS